MRLTIAIARVLLERSAGTPSERSTPGQVDRLLPSALASWSRVRQRWILGRRSSSH